MFINIKLKTERDNTMNKTIITVVGNDTVGIIAKVCTYLADNQVNILDISQTILDDMFTMMMISDVDKCSISFGELSKALADEGEKLGVEIRIQLEQIFQSMHRI